MGLLDDVQHGVAAIARVVDGMKRDYAAQVEENLRLCGVVDELRAELRTLECENTKLQSMARGPHCWYGRGDLMANQDERNEITVRLKSDGRSVKKLRRRVRELERQLSAFSERISDAKADVMGAAYKLEKMEERFATHSHARLSQLYAHVMILEASVVTVSEDFNTAEEKEACASLGRSDASICLAPESPWCAYLAAYNDAVLEREAADPGVLAACGM
jgi:predicted nuclease with TOPRIM domain